jgi:hypothetical protein
MSRRLSDFQIADKFETWFVGLLSSWDTSQSKIFTDTLRGAKQQLFEEFCRICDGGEPKVTARALIFREGEVNDQGRIARPTKKKRQYTKRKPKE